jgi:hypothetical protein
VAIDIELRGVLSRGLPIYLSKLSVARGIKIGSDMGKERATFTLLVGLFENGIKGS